MSEFKTTKKIFSGAVKLFMVFAFTFSVCLPVCAQYEAGSIFDPEAVNVPDEYGTVQDSFKGEGEKLIVYIQDAHCVYEAQKNIAEILEYMAKEYDFRLVALEGGERKIDLEIFRSFPYKDTREKVTHDYMQKGELTGAEYIGINSEVEFILYGVEDLSLYKQDKRAFLNALAKKSIIKSKLKRIKDKLDTIRDNIYGEKLQELMKKIEGYEEGRVDLLPFIDYLVAVNSDTGKFPLIEALLDAKKEERTFNFYKINKLAEELIEKIQSRLTTNDEKLYFEFITTSQRRGEIKREKFYEYIQHKVKKLRIDLEPYSEFFRYLKYLDKLDEIKSRDFFDELENYVEATKNKFFETESDRILDKMYHHVKILEKMANLELVRDDFIYYTLNKSEFTEEFFTTFINRELEKIQEVRLAEGETPETSAFLTRSFLLKPQETAELDSLIELPVKFYELACKRDDILYENMLKAMRAEGTEVSFLITGGFHTQGITERLEKDNISYIVVSPNITEPQKETPYLKIMRGKGILHSSGR